MGKKITDLTELTDTQSGDFVVIVDSSDNEMKKAEISKIININSGNFFARYASDFNISDLNTGQFSFILDTPKTVDASSPFPQDRSVTYEPVRYSVTGLPSNVEVKFLSFPITSAVRTQGGGNSNLVFDQDIFGPEQTSGFINSPVGGDFDRDFLSNGQTGDLIEAIVRANSNNQDTPRDEIFTISHGGDCIVELKETSTSEDKTVILRQTGILAFNTGLVTYQFTAHHRGS